MLQIAPIGVFQASNGRKLYIFLCKMLSLALKNIWYLFSLRIVCRIFSGISSKSAFEIQKK